MLAFRAFDIFELAEAHLDTFRGIRAVDRIGGIRAGAAGAVDQRGGAVTGGIETEHGVSRTPSRHCGAWGALYTPQAERKLR